MTSKKVNWSISILSVMFGITNHNSSIALSACPKRLDLRVLSRLVSRLQPWQTSGRAVAADRTVLRANGGVWQVKQRKQGIGPHTSIEVEADWTKSGWPGWG